MRSDSALPPLVVDLDGTLIAGDTLRISIGILARRSPWLLAALPVVLLRGRPAFKRFVASRVVPDPRTLPWRSDVLKFVRAEHERGRKVLLATAADIRIAKSVSAHLGCFDGLIATDGGLNLKAEAKLASIRNILHSNNFEYIGDSRHDLPIFRAASGSYLVAPSPRLRKAASKEAVVKQVFEDR